MMTETPQPTESGSSSRRSWWPWVIATVVIACAVVIGAMVAAARNDDDTNSAGKSFPMMQTSNMQQACAQWSDQAGDTPSPEWCSAMADQMGSLMANGGMMGNGPMMGSMMSGDVDAMVNACEQWMTTTPTAAGSTSASAWCTQMGEWMSNGGN